MCVNLYSTILIRFNAELQTYCLHKLEYKFHSLAHRHKVACLSFFTDHYVTGDCAYELLQFILLAASYHLTSSRISGHHHAFVYIHFKRTKRFSSSFIRESPQLTTWNRVTPSARNHFGSQEQCEIRIIFFVYTHVKVFTSGLTRFRVDKSGGSHMRTTREWNSLFVSGFRTPRTRISLRCD